MTGQTSEGIGKVYLVGAGPGDPGLLTLRGKECLLQADVVIHDYLANPKLLQYAPQATAISLGKHGGGRVMTQAEINEKIVEFAQQGQIVVRLKGGDPAIFARAHEELQAIIEHQIPYEIVPGITAALAVTGSVGIPLTHRDYSSAVALVTGQGKEGSGKEGGPPLNLDFGALAKFPGTLVFYMGTTTVEHWTGELIKAGMDPETPVVAVRHCSLPTQVSFRCSLSDLPSRVNQVRKLRPPVLFVVGQTAQQYGLHNWFESRPLFGRSILVTRPAHQAGSLATQLEELGAEVLLQPAIEIVEPESKTEIAATLSDLGKFDWIVFSSVNGVQFFMDALWSAHDLRALGNCRFATVGPATAARLEEFHLRADLIPASFEAESLAAALVDRVASQRVLLIRASRGREVLHDELQKVAAEVKQLVCYESRDVETADESVQARMSNGEIDYVTVTSSAIARSLANLFGNALKNTALVSISPITSATLRELGYEPALEATEYTMQGVLSAILRHQN